MYLKLIFLEIFIDQCKEILRQNNILSSIRVVAKCRTNMAHKWTEIECTRTAARDGGQRGGEGLKYVFLRVKCVIENI